MKKITLFFAALFVAMTAFAQEVKVEKLWSKTTADLEVKDLRNGFDVINGELLLASRRAVDTEVVVYDAATGTPKMAGDVIEQLKATPLSMTYAGGDVVVDENGVIYLASSNNTDVYKFDNKAAAPEKFVTLPAVGFWAFDVMVDKDGNGCLIAAVQNTQNIYYATIANNVAGEIKTIDFGKDLGGTPHVNIVSAKTFWVDGGNILPTLVTLAEDNSIVSSKAIETANVVATATGVQQFEYNGKTYLVCAANNHNGTVTLPKHSLALFEINPATLELTVVGEFLPAEGMGASASGTTDEPVVEVKEDGAYIYYLAGYNGLAAFKLSSTAAKPTTPTSFATFQEALDFLTRPEVTDAELAATYAVEEPAVVTMNYIGQMGWNMINWSFLQVNNDGALSHFVMSPKVATPLAIGDSITAKVSFDADQSLMSIMEATVIKNKAAISYTKVLVDDIVYAEDPNVYMGMPVIVEGTYFHEDAFIGELMLGGNLESFVSNDTKEVVAKGVITVLSSPMGSSAAFIVSEMKLKDDGSATAVENAELSSNVYSSNGTLFVEAEAGDMINVYTVDGRNIYSAVAASSLNSINVKADMVIVRVNNEVHKAVIK